MLVWYLVKIDIIAFWYLLYITNKDIEGWSLPEQTKVKKIEVNQNSRISKDSFPQIKS